MKKVIFALLFLLIATPVFAEEVLLIDKWMIDPVAFKPFFDNFPKNGMTLKYRRFHPTLVESDITNYKLIIICGGLHPKPAATHMTPEEGALLKTFVRNGGVAVFMFANEYVCPDHTDNYIFNTIFDSLGVKIRAEGQYIQDPNGNRSTLVPASYYCNLPTVEVSKDTPLGEGIDKPFNAGRLLSIMVGQYDVEIPAWSSPTSLRRVSMPSSPERGQEAYYAGEPRSYAAVVTAKAGKGYVVLTSRWLLNLTGYTGKWSDKPFLPPYEQKENKQFGINFTKYIAQIAKGEYTPKTLLPIRRFENLPALTPPAFKFRSITLDKAAPADSYAELPAFPDASPTLLSFLNGDKVKSGYIGIPDKSDAERQAKIYKAAGLNLIFAVGGHEFVTQWDNPAAVQRARENCEEIVKQCQKVGIKVLLGGYVPMTGAWENKKYPTALVDGSGRTWQPPSPFDPESWEDCLMRPAREFAKIGKKYPDTMVGSLWDFELYNHDELIITESYPYDNLAFGKFIAKEEKLLRKLNIYQEAIEVDQTQRLTWLEKKGLLKTYYADMEDIIYQMASKARAEVEKIQPNHLWGFYAAGIPQSWYYRGMFRGLANKDKQILLATYEARGAQQVSYWKTIGVNMVHLPGILMDSAKGEEWTKFIKMCLANEGGYWLFPVGMLNGDEKSWRSWSGDSTMLESPESAIEWIKKGNE